MARAKRIPPVLVKVGGDTKGLKGALDRAEKQVKGFSGRLSKGLKAGLLAAGAGAAAVTAGLTKLAFDADEARAVVLRATGAVGEEAKKQTNEFLEVAGRVPEALNVVAEAFGDVRTRFKGSNEAVGQLTESLIDYARVSGGDPVLVSTNLGRAFQSWTDDATVAIGSLDTLTKVGQDYGYTADRIAKDMQKFGPVFKNAGFSIEETAVIMARLHGAGVDLTRVTPGINAFLRKVAEAGGDPRQALIDAENAIRNAKTEAEALALATKFFGAEGAQRLVAAIRGSEAIFTGLQGEIDAAEGSLQTTVDTTTTLKERFQEFINNAKTNIQQKLLAAFESIGAWWSENFPKFKEAWQKFWDSSQPLREQLVAFFKRVGELVLQVAVGLGEFVVDAVKKVVEWVKRFKEQNPATFLAAVGVAVGVLAIAVSVKLVAALVAVTAATVAWTIALLANPITWVVAGIAALVVGIVYAYENFGWFRTAVQKTWEFLQFLWEWLKQVPGWIRVAWDAVWDFFKNFPESMQKVLDWFKLLPGRVLELAKQGFAKLIELGANLARLLLDQMPAVLEWFKQLPAKGFEMTKAGFGKLVELGKKLKDLLMANMPNILEWFKKLPGRMWEAVKRGFYYYTWFGRKIVELVVKALVGLVNWFKEFGPKFWNWIKAAFPKIVQFGKEMAKKMMTAMKDGILGQVTALANVLRDLLRKAWNKAKEGMSGALSWIGDKVGFGAEGGIVTRPTLAVLGEAGPEAVVPLNRMPGARALPAGAGGGVVVNVVVEGSLYGDEDRLGETVVSALEAWTRRNGGTLPWVQ